MKEIFCVECMVKPSLLNVTLLMKAMSKASNFIKYANMSLYIILLKLGISILNESLISCDVTIQKQLKRQIII